MHRSWNSSLGTSLALGQADGIPGPVIHQLVQVVCESPLALQGLRGRVSARWLGQGVTVGGTAV